ncbi:MAG: hypothetical protein ACXVA9_12075 [Bdellovibrionales bacterium]
MKLRLFHKIGDGGQESAAVRQFLVENALEELIEFSNVGYDESRQALFELAGPDAQAPVLIANGRPIRGRSAIIDWLKTNILVLRD